MHPIEFITELHDHAEALVKALQALRDNTTDEQWDTFCDNEHLDALISAACDIEDTMEK